jgi:hypothetical protein
VGCFVSFTLYDTRLLELFPESFVRHFFPPPPAAPPAGTFTSALPTSAFAGQYRDVSHARGTIEKLIHLTEQIVAHAEPDGTLTVNLGSLRPGDVRMTRVDALRFREIDWNRESEPFEVAFRVDESSRVTHMMAGTEAFGRLSPVEHPRLHRAAFKSFAIVFFWGGFGWPALCFAAARRLRRTQAGSSDAHSRRCA